MHLTGYSGLCPLPPAGDADGSAGCNVERIAMTNISTYKAIALEAHKSMCEYLEEGRWPKEDGGPGWIKTFDPDQKCFKQAMITIVFTGMWLEALLHLLIVRNHGLEKFAEYDFKSYEEKLRLLGCSEQGLLDVVKRFRKSRKELVHEKAYCDDGELKTAQDEANNAHDLMVHAFFNNQPN